MSQVTPDNATAGHPGDDVAALLAKAESLCRAVARRDLAGIPIYMVPQSSLPAGDYGGEHHYSLTSPSLDLHLREHIPNWRGRGPALLINDIGIREDFHADDWEYVVQAFTLHELAHVLDRPALIADRTGTDPDLLVFESLVVADCTKRPPRTDLPAHFGHEVRFIRAALHLVARAERLGVAIGPGAVCAGYQYGLSHASRYQQALGDEPERMADWLFRDILAEKPPPEFSQLWTDDIIAYQDHFPTQHGESHVLDELVREDSR